MTTSESFFSALSVVKGQLRQQVIKPDDIENLSRELSHNPIGFHDVYELAAIIDPLIKQENYWSMDPDSTVIELFQNILAKVPWANILEMYSMDFTLDNVANNNQYSLLILKVLNSHSHELDYEDSDLLKTLLSIYLGDKNLIISVTNQLQQLIESVPDKSVLNKQQYQQIFHTVKVGGDSVLVSRLLELIVDLVPVVEFDMDFALTLDDELFTLLLINFYERLVDKQIPEVLAAISGKINEIVDLFSQRKDDESIQMFLITDIINFLATLSYKFPGEFPEKLLSPVALYLDTDYDVRLVSKINPEVFSRDLLEYLLEFPLLNQRYFQVLLNLLRSESSLQFLVEKEKVSSNALQQLSIDYLYEVLITMCSTSFGVSYLLNNCPSILNDKVIDHIPANTDIFNMKLKLLESLLFNDHDLLIWQDRLVNTYKTMKNGRSIRAEPRVDIVDEASS